MAKAKNEHIAVRFIGDREPFDDDLIKLMEEAENSDVGEIITTVQIALNYGGRDEIVHSVKEIAEKIKKGELSPEDITEELISDNLYSETPECDLIIRPSGEERLSNFLLWDSAYSELYFTSTLWPDFDEKSVDECVFEFYKRKRRFGGV
jgi:undecaprenyl diphosphate synthase